MSDDPDTPRYSARQLRAELDRLRDHYLREIARMNLPVSVPDGYVDGLLTILQGASMTIKHSLRIGYDSGILISDLHRIDEAIDAALSAFSELSDPAPNGRHGRPDGPSRASANLS